MNLQPTFGSFHKRLMNRSKNACMHKLLFVLTPQRFLLALNLNVQKIQSKVWEPDPSVPKVSIWNYIRGREQKHKNTYIFKKFATVFEKNI